MPLTLKDWREGIAYNRCEVMGLKYYLWLLCLVFCAGNASAQIYNGDFELSEPNEALGINLPTGWETENYATVDCNFVPDPNPRRGSSINWQIDTNVGLMPFQGESFVILSTDDIVPEPQYARILQNVEFFEGQRISGAYFFGTYDYIPFDDNASITLVPDDSEGRSVILVAIGVSGVGSYGSTPGWVTFGHAFTAEDAGVYDLVISVGDYGDIIFTTYFAVDALEVCWVAPYGDVNADCEVNLIDFSFLAADWLLYDSVYEPDPNFAAQYDTDFDGDHFVDVNDVSLMAEYWLFEQ